MVSVENRDEPSMDDILACVRRILAEEEAGKAAPAPARARESARDGVLTLTNMVGPDGSVAAITPVTPIGAARLAPPQNPFAALDTLKGRVAALLASQPSAPGAGAAGGAGLGLTLKAAAKFILPAAISRRIPALAAAGGGSRDGIHAASAPPAPARPRPGDMLPRFDTASVEVAALAVEWADPDAGAKRKVRVPMTVNAAPQPLEASGAEPDAGAAAGPANQIERLLAHQIAAAHGAAMTLAEAAMHHVQRGDGARGPRAPAAEAAKLAASAAQMMKACNEGLATLAMLRAGGEPTPSARKAAARRGAKGFAHPIAANGRHRTKKPRAAIRDRRRPPALSAATH